MRNTIVQRGLLGAILAGLLATGFAFVRPTKAEAADAAKNIKVLKGMSKADIKKYMKEVAKALGVQCDHCHDTDDMSLDTDMKNKARAMMTMVDEINKTNFKGAKRVKCVTCHNGSIKPK